MADQNSLQAANGTDAAAPPSALHPATQTIDPLPENGDELEAEASDDGDSAFGDSNQSGSTSLRSSILAGVFDNGRRYQVTRDTEIGIPSDEKQFGSMEAGHMAYTILESQQENPFFRSKLSPNAQQVLDVGTGQGGWAIDVADRFPNLTVHGIDLYPPPQNWVPPNCILEVDDCTKPWTWDVKFDLVHIRLLCGSFPEAEWERLYRRAYHNLAPGGWIEHADTAIPIHCDDGSLPKDSLLAGYGDQLNACGEAAGTTGKVTSMMRDLAEKAGFINIHERDYKFPIGTWPKHPVYKEAGEMFEQCFREGLQGWVMFALTKFGLPKPWSHEEVTVYVAKIREELDKKPHIYTWHKRVWAQKPFDAPKNEQ